jgi:hypothetical protein
MNCNIPWRKNRSRYTLEEVIEIKPHLLLREEEWNKIDPIPREIGIYLDVMNSNSEEPGDVDDATDEPEEMPDFGGDVEVSIECVGYTRSIVTYTDDEETYFEVQISEDDKTWETVEIIMVEGYILGLLIKQKGVNNH